MDLQTGFQPDHQGPDRRDTVRLSGRAAGFILTAAAHLALFAAFLFSVRAGAPALHDVKPLAVSIEKRAQMPLSVLHIMPKMMPAQAIYVPTPEFSVVPEPSPVRVSVAPVRTVATPVPIAPATVAPQPGTADLDYINLLHEFLQKELDEQHPHGALGTAVVFYTIDRAGHILSFKIVKSSGYTTVDNNAMLLMQTSGAFPPMPDSIAGDTFSDRVNVTYRAASLSSSYKHLINR